MERILATTAFALFLTGCATEQPKSCGWDQEIYPGDTECAREGNGEGPSAPEPAAAPEPEPAPEPPEPVAAPVADQEPAPAPTARPEPVTPASVPDKPEPEKPVDPEPEPEPEKPRYEDWSNPLDQEVFEGLPPEVVAEKKMQIAAARARAEADHDAQFGGDKAGGYNR